MMTTQISLWEYKDMCQDLPEIVSLQACCSKPMEKVQVEPLEGRGTLETERTCVVMCPECGKRYVSRWD